MHTTTDNQAKTFTAEKSRIQGFTDFTAEFPHEHAFLFDGIILGICSKGNMRFKINYNEYHISANEAFVILPRHIFTIIRTSPDLQLKILRFSSDFLLTLPTNPDFSLARRISHYPCISIQPQDMENIQLLYTMARQYESLSDLTLQLQSSLLPSLLLHHSNKLLHAESSLYPGKRISQSPSSIFYYNIIRLREV